MSRTRITPPSSAHLSSLIHASSGDQRTGLTGASGVCQFEGLAPAEYRIEIAAPGFTLHTQSVTVAAGRRIIEALLDVAPFSENVTVEAVATVPTIGRIKVPLRDQPLTVNTLSSELFTRAVFADYFTNAGVNLSGRIPRRAPRHTVNFSGEYVWQNGFSLMGGGQVVSHQFINDTDTVGFSAYELLYAGVTYMRGRIRYGLNLTNLTDREYWTSSLGNRQLYPGEPFNVMASIRIRTN